MELFGHRTFYYSQGLHKMLCFMSYNALLQTKHWETNIACAAVAATPRPSEVQRFHSWHDLGVMGMTHPSHTPPHPSSMTCIARYTTSRTESATGHPHTDPPTGAAHASHKLLAHALSRCIQNTAHNNTEIFPGFLLPDLHLTLSALGEMSRSPVKGSVDISHNVSKWKPCVWLAVSGKWAGGRDLN